MKLRQAIPALLATTMFACAEPQMKEPEPTATPTTVELGEGRPITIKAHLNDYVTCEMALEGENKNMLAASRYAPGDWERFTMFTRADGKVSFKAANGKFVCWDELKGGVLFADRDQAGDWETFTLVPMDSGKVALKVANGTFVSADYDLKDERKGTLVGNRQEAHEWETFTLEPVVVPAAQ
ncbi:MAG: hypothetical protein JNM62_05065 [Flavobacteriales bacterium]|nr:hypothetical protein [Flavobacteriales bacterium]